MTRRSEPRLQLRDGASASPLPSIREKMQAGHAERVEVAPGTTSVALSQGALDHEKCVHSHGGFQGDVPMANALSAPSSSLETAAASTLPNNSSQENNEYISGPKLYISLFSIISVFFLVLLDFSILSPVSTDSSQASLRLIFWTATIQIADDFTPTSSYRLFRTLQVISRGCKSMCSCEKHY